jgi:hypothetical protein
VKVIWIAEERIIPALKRVVDDGRVKNGDDITEAPSALRDQLVEQGLAEVQDDADAPNIATPEVAPEVKKRGKSGGS